MIKFFRTIRHNLMEKNRTGRYFKYAIGEIILVVIGILIALQINNWNEKRKQHNAEIDFYNGVKNDLVKDKAYIELILEKTDVKIDAYKNLKQDLPKSTLDSLLSIYIFNGQRTFYPISGSFQSAVAGNEINTYKNKSTIGQLITLYNSTYPRLLDNASIVDDRWSNLSEKYRHERRVGSFENMNKDQISKVLDDVYFHFIQLRWYKNTLTNAKTEIEHLLNSLHD